MPTTTNFYQDQLGIGYDPFAPGGGQGGIMVPPAPADGGIGLAPPPAAAPPAMQQPLEGPPVQGSPALVQAQPPPPRDLAIAQMTGLRRFGSAMGEWGAAVTNTKSPLDTQIEQVMARRKLQNDEQKEALDAYTHYSKILDQMEDGPAKHAFAESAGQALDAQHRGVNLGAALEAYASNPNMLAYQPFVKFMSPADQAMAKNFPAKFRAHMATPEGQKKLEAASYVPVDQAIQAKLSVLEHLAQTNPAELGPLDPHDIADFVNNPSMAGARKIDRALAPDSVYKLSREELQRLDTTHEHVSDSLGLMNDKDMQALHLDAMKPHREVKDVPVMDAKGNQKTDSQGRPLYQQAVVDIGGKEPKVIAQFGPPHLMQGGVNVYTGGLTPAIDPATNESVLLGKNAATGKVAAAKNPQGQNYSAAQPGGQVALTPEGMKLAEELVRAGRSRFQLPTNAMLNEMAQTEKGGAGSGDVAQDMMHYKNEAAVRKDFTSGTTSKTITNLNMVIGHMGTLDDLTAALEAHDSKALNKGIQAVSRQFNNPAINNADLATQAVANELMRTFRQVQGSETETLAFEKKFSTALTPAEKLGALQTGAKLLQSRLESLNGQWKRGTGEEEFPHLLDQRSKDVLKQLSRTAPAIEVIGGGKVVQPTTPAERRKHVGGQTTAPIIDPLLQPGGEPAAQGLEVTRGQGGARAAPISPLSRGGATATPTTPLKRQGGDTAAPVGPYKDAAKERAYQEWLKKHPEYH